MLIRTMKEDDLKGASKVHAKAFVRQKLSRKWLECTLNAFPRTLCYLAVIDSHITGYIIWAQKSGFRPDVILELEQIAVLPEHQGKGIGKKLIEKSLPLVRNHLSEQGATLKHIVVTTRADNHAQKLYKQVLGAEVEAIISNLYSADEVFMVARNV